MKDNNNQALLIIPTKQPNSNDSISSFESMINQLSVQQSKFCSIFIQNWQLFEVHVNSFQISNSHHLFGFGSKFIIGQTYQLKIVTDHLCYYVEKRYRDFLALYNKVTMFYQSKIVFPRKTHFRSKVCPFVTEGRRKIFDDFLSEIISLRHSNKSVISELISFLDIRSHYKQLNLDQSIFLIQNIADCIKGDKGYLFGHFLRHQLLKIQIIPNKSLQSLKKLQNLLCSVNRNFIKVDDLRTLLLGANRIPGLLQLALSNNNQVVSLTFLKQIKKLMDVQICPYAQTFKKIFENTAIHALYLNNVELLQYEQFASSYFQIIDLYLKLRLNHQNTRTDNLIKDILKPQAIQQYVQWKTGKRQRDFQIRRKTKLQMNQFKLQKYQIKSKVQISQYKEEDNDSQEQNKLQFDKQIQNVFDNKNLSTNKYQKLFISESSYLEVSLDGRFMHFVVNSKKKFDDVCEIVKKWSHNKLVTSYYPPNILTKINKIFFTFEGKSEKLFQFQEDILTNKQNKQGKLNQSQNQQKQIQDKKFQNQLNQLTISLTPSIQLKTANSFYYRLKVKQMSQQVTSIQILYYFHRKKIRKMFEQQCSGKSTIMWDSICNTLLDGKQVSSFSSAKTQQTINQQIC